MSVWARRRVISSLAILAATAAVVAGCSNGSDSGSSDMPSVVASTDVWGSVAKAVAGDDAKVRSIYSSPDGDPHEFEATARDVADISSADVVVLNGADYDHYMETAPHKSGSATVNADAIYRSAHPDAATATGEVNEHYFYNYSVVKGVADAIADDLGKKNPDAKQKYADNAAAFGRKLDTLTESATAIKAKHNGTKVAQTEPLAYYLLQLAGLTDATPASFTEAVEAGNDPPAAAVATTSDLITKKTVAALIYNVQATDEITKRLLESTSKAGVPVVKLTETLPQGVSDYIAWQRTTVDAIAQALSR